MQLLASDHRQAYFAAINQRYSPQPIKQEAKKPPSQAHTPSDSPLFNPKMLSSKANEHYGNQEFHQAMKLYKNLVDHYRPRSDKKAELQASIYNQGICAYFLQDFTTAISCLSEAAELEEIRSKKTGKPVDPKYQTKLTKATESSKLQSTAKAPS
jgi:tetratricopeptide (TPR) repeat protein